MSKSLANLELFLYKNKLNEKTLIDLMSKFSSNTIQHLIKDLSVVEEVKDNINVNFIFTDGGAINNGKKNCKAAYSVYCGENSVYNKTELIKSSDNPSNNVAELSGIKCILSTLLSEMTREGLKKNKFNTVIVTDSLFSIKCLTVWNKSWEKNGWKNAKKEPVVNKELIQSILQYMENIKESSNEITFKHIFSHQKEPIDKKSLEYFLWKGNDICDKNVSDLLNKNEN
jgi:ribonuclease HI